MAYKTFSVRFSASDVDPGMDGIAAVFNTATDPASTVVIVEVRLVPKAINDDQTNVLGNQGILSIDRCSTDSYTGGTEVFAIPFDTASATVGSGNDWENVRIMRAPGNITLGDTIRRFGDCVSTYTITKATMGLQAMLRAPGVLDCNDHTGRVDDGMDVWHAMKDSNIEPIVLHQGEGLSLTKRAWGVPQAMHVAIVFQIVYTGSFYRLIDADIGTPDGLNVPIIAFLNLGDSGTDVKVWIVAMPDEGEENQPQYRLIRCEDKTFGSTGTSVPVVSHDTGYTITGVSAITGPVRLYPLAHSHGADVDYYDYASSATAGRVALQQKADTFRRFCGCGPYMTTTAQINMHPAILSRGAEYELYPGDRRGIGTGTPITLRPNQGLAIVGGGGGSIETSELAYLEIEMTGYITTEPGPPAAKESSLILS